MTENPQVSLITKAQCPRVCADPGRIGFHAATREEFTAAFEKALTVEDPLAMRLRARESAWRFSEGEFARKWLEQMAALVALTKPKA